MSDYEFYERLVSVFTPQMISSKDSSLELVAERAGISHATLVSIEKGASTVSIGAYAAALHALNNMDRDLLLVAKDDELSRKLQDLGLPVRKRAPKRGW